MLTVAEPLGSCLQQRAEAGEAVRRREVVLDVLLRVDDRHRSGLAGLDALEQVQDLLLVRHFLLLLMR